MGSVCPTAIANVAAGPSLYIVCFCPLLVVTISLFCSAGFAPQDRLWAGLGALSRTINERDRRHAVLSMHNAELRAAASGGDELVMLQVLLLLLL